MSEEVDPGDGAGAAGISAPAGSAGDPHGGVAGGSGSVTPVRPHRLWYGVAVVVLLVGVAVGAVTFVLGLGSGGRGGAGRAGVVVGLVGLVACPSVAFLVAAGMGLVVAVRRNAHRDRSRRVRE